MDICAPFIHFFILNHLAIFLCYLFCHFDTLLCFKIMLGIPSSLLFFISYSFFLSFIHLFFFLLPSSFWFSFFLNFFFRFQTFLVPNRITMSGAKCERPVTRYQPPDWYSRNSKLASNARCQFHPRLRS